MLINLLAELFKYEGTRDEIKSKFLGICHFSSALNFCLPSRNVKFS